MKRMVHFILALVMMFTLTTTQMPPARAVVLPHANVKIFLTASAHTRAMRRCKELEERGTPQPLDEVLADIVARDEIDCNRPIAPLRQAEDAVLLDTSNLNFAESEAAILKVIEEHL